MCASPKHPETLNPEPRQAFYQNLREVGKRQVIASLLPGSTQQNAQSIPELA